MSGMFDPDVGRYISPDGTKWFGEARHVRVSRGGGMRTRGPVGKVTVSYDRKVRRRVLQAAAERDARMRGEAS